MMRALCVAVLLLAAAAALAETAKPTENDPVASAREFNLARKLRCLVCQNETIAESRADLALDLRRQVREQIAAGKSDREIIDFMTSRYGDFVLFDPPVKPTTWLLWGGPFALVLFGLLIGWRVIRGRQQAPAATALTDAERQRAAQLLQVPAADAERKPS